jgi:hypothetical protein
MPPEETRKHRLHLVHDAGDISPERRAAIDRWRRWRARLNLPPPEGIPIGRVLPAIPALWHLYGREK